MSEFELNYIKEFINNYEMIYRNAGFDPFMEHILEDLTELVKRYESDVR